MLQQMTSLIWSLYKNEYKNEIRGRVISEPLYPLFTGVYRKNGGNHPMGGDKNEKPFAQVSALAEKKL